MRRRIQGTEHEYTLFSGRMHERCVDPHSLALQLLHSSGLHAAGEFLANGSRAYLDVGHMELSTCETSNPMDLLRWEKAGEKIVDWARKVAEERYLSEGQHIWAYKNNTSPDGTSYGSHENYLVDRRVDFPAAFLEGLVPHLVSRMIYTGAGDILDGKYVISPSAYLTSHLISGNTMHGTGVLNTRDESHGDPSRFRRLHLLIGDALMNENAILLRQFTTTGVLELIEDGRLGDAPRLAEPLRDMWQNIEHRDPEKWGFELKGGKKVSPVDIQRYYLGKLEPLVRSRHEKRAFRMLEEVLDLIEKKRTRELGRKVEWVDRYMAIREHLEKDQKKDPEAEMTACKRYSELSEGRSLYHRRVRAGLIDRLLTDEEVARAVTMAPSDTRAALRTRLAGQKEVVRIDWSDMTVKVDGTFEDIIMDDPFETEKYATRAHGRWGEPYGGAGTAQEKEEKAG